MPRKHHRRFMDAAEEYRYQQMRNFERRKWFDKWGLRIGILIALLMAGAVCFVYLT